MKTFPSTRGTAALALLLCCLANSALSAELSKPVAPLEVSFNKPENYTDWMLSGGADWYRESVFTAVRTFLAKQAEPLLPAGDTLSITFTDVDLGNRASRRESAAGAPSFEFSYRVTDAAGAVVRHGTENLRSYLDFAHYRYSVETTDLTTEIIQSEKPMLKDWTVRALDGLK